METPPEFLDKLGLLFHSAEVSVNAVNEMVAQLATQLGEERPWWLDGKALNFFEIKVETDRK